MSCLRVKILMALLLGMVFSIGCTAPNGSDGASEGPSDSVQLENTHWRLTHLSGHPVAQVEGRPGAHLILRSEQGQAGGSDGCNSFFGGYRVEGESIGFDPLAATKMYCAEGMDTADAFHAALAEARRWRVQGERLELYDASGGVVAGFQATQPE